MLKHMGLDPEDWMKVDALKNEGKDFSQWPFHILFSLPEAYANGHSNLGDEALATLNDVGPCCYALGASFTEDEAGSSNDGF